MIREGRGPVAWAGVSGGLFGGSAVGIGEALYLLSTTTPTEFQALVYAAVLYGLAGGALGGALGLVLAATWSLTRVRVARAWALAAFGTLGALGVPVARYLLHRARFQELGVPDPATLQLIAAFVLPSLVGVWLATLFLTKTPLKVLPGAKGTLAGWGGLVVLALLFSLAPPPGVVANPVPRRPQSGLEERPNVLVVQVDALRADALGVYGNGPDVTPALDALAREAVVFDQYVVSAPWTRPSTASLLSGELPVHHGCESRDAALPAEVDTVAEVFQAHSYATAGFPNNPNITAARGFAQGFDWYPYAPRFPFAARESTYALSLYTALRKTWVRHTDHREVEHWYTPAETLLPEVLDWIDAQQGDRWFAFVHLMEPHDPWFAHPYDGTAVGRADLPAPDPARRDELRARYLGEVHHVDAELGRFLAALAERGELDRTVLVVTADHGEELLDHGGWWHGATLYDEVVRVPLLIRLPGAERGGTRVPWQVRQVDVAPTLAQLARIAPSPRWEGEELFVDDFDRQLVLLQPPGTGPAEGGDPDEPPPPPPADWSPPTWADHPASRDAVISVDFEGYRLHGLRAEGHKLVAAERVPRSNPRQQPPRSCFDLLADPRETVDLVAAGRTACLARFEPRLAARLGTRASGGASGAVPEGEAGRLEALGYAGADGE